MIRCADVECAVLAGKRHETCRALGGYEPPRAGSRRPGRYPVRELRPGLCRREAGHGRRCPGEREDSGGVMQKCWNARELNRSSRAFVAVLSAFRAPPALPATASRGSRADVSRKRRRAPPPGEDRVEYRRLFDRVAGAATAIRGRDYLRQSRLISRRRGPGYLTQIVDGASLSRRRAPSCTTGGTGRSEWRSRPRGCRR
jgi:hypothetical protein